MTHVICALTCGRVEETRRTWEHNLGGNQHPLLWWDNTEDAAEREAIAEIARQYEKKTAFQVGKNMGIAYPLNMMMQFAFEVLHADAVTTMANDILEPAGWIGKRSAYLERIPGAGIVSIPFDTPGCARYHRKGENGLVYEEGDIIGNFTISRAVWEAIGGMPEIYGIYGPIDLEYNARARRAGFRTIYIANEAAEHIGDNNPPAYQAAKMESLAIGWPLYIERLGKINRGEI